MKKVNLRDLLSEYNGLYPGISVLYTNHSKTISADRVIVIGITSIEILKDRSMLLHLFNGKSHLIKIENEECYSYHFKFDYVCPDSITEVEEILKYEENLTVAVIDGVC